MNEIITDLQGLIADLQALEQQMVTEGKTEVALAVKFVTAQFTAILAELQKLL
ncbi:MAG TPA: hypothetical protein VGG75_38295 [Trebonia sp.]|jgi:hypothetical protein